MPVSSSAHLVAFQDLLHIGGNKILLDIVLHLGSLFAVIVFLFKDIRGFVRNKKILFLTFLATAFTAMVVLLCEAVLGKGCFEDMFSSAQGAALPLFISGIILLCTKKFTRGARALKSLRIPDAAWMGIVQGFAVIPGLSRSGLTISTLLFRGVEMESAFKFSFFASIFAISGALVLKIGDFSQVTFFEGRYMLLGFFASFLSSLLALKILLAVIRRARLHLFGYYCLAAGLLLWRIFR